MNFKTLELTIQNNALKESQKDNDEEKVIVQNEDRRKTQQKIPVVLQQNSSISSGQSQATPSHITTPQHASTFNPTAAKKAKKNDEYTTNETVLYFDSNEKRMLDAIVVGKASVKVNRIINNDGHCFHININHLAKKITTENHC